MRVVRRSLIPPRDLSGLDVDRNHGAGVEVVALAARADDPFRGHDGPLVLERGPASTPLFGAFFEAVQEAGYPLTDDVNGFRQEGMAPFDRNIRRGRRWSATRAYLAIRTT